MAAFDYATLAVDVAAMITDMGQTVALVEDGTETPATALVLDYGARERDGDLILADDRNALIVPLTDGTTPDPELHRLKINGESFRIVSVRTVSPAGIVLYHDCQIRL